MTRLRLLIADDVEIVAEAFEALLSAVPEFDVVARVGRGDLVKEAALTHRPDVALLDVDMPGASGIEAAADIQSVLPECKVLLLSALEGGGHLHRALAVGASGYILKTTTAARLVDAIKTVAAGGTVIDPGLAVAALRQGPSPLTAREIEILRLTGEGQSTESVAKSLHLSAGTVRNYLSSAMLKLDATNRAGAFDKAKRNGWL